MMMKPVTIINKLDVIERELEVLKGLPRSDRKAFNRKDTLRKRRKKLLASLPLAVLVEERKLTRVAR